MTSRTIRTTLAAVTGALALATSPVASAAPVGVEAHELSRSNSDGFDFIVREITIAPGGSTGWHWHDGTLLGAVKHGTLTHFGANCQVDGVYSAGGTVVEPSGADHVHVGRNLGPEPVTLEVLYVLPQGKPLSEEAPNPGCPFS
jgi:quercetin dioxygenase-like cupin family protein